MGLLSGLFDRIFEQELEEYKTITIEKQNGTIVKIDIKILNDK